METSEIKTQLVDAEGKPLSKRALKKAAKNKGKEKKVKDPNHGVPKADKAKKVDGKNQFLFFLVFNGTT